MSRSERRLAVALTAAAVAFAAPVFAPSASASDAFPGIGRAATPAEIAAWDIDVRPDFLGLPAGAGTVEEGEVIWEAQCASCHGSFGEANTTFTPIIGGTTAEDMETGRVAALERPDYPQRTTMMKVPTIATLYDYIRRAMPWTEPKSLSDDEVYAVLAYMLNLADIVPWEFELNDRTIREVQEILPNRNGMTTEHAMWPGAEFGQGGRAPDVQGDPCMADCVAEVTITSSLPDHAWPAHGNLAVQNRVVGPVRGRVTGDEAFSFDAPADGILVVAEEWGCLACHGAREAIVGPGFNEVALRYRGRNVTDELVARLRAGAEGGWGPIPMPPQIDVPEEDLKALVAWILEGAS